MVSAMEQLRSFFISIGTGMTMGLLYDLVWLFRSRLHWKRIGTGIGDILFWVVTTGLAFFLLLFANNGEMRVFVYLGMFLGLALYFWWFSNSWRRLIMAGTGMLLQIVVALWTAIVWPFRLITKVLLVPVELLSRFSGLVVQPGYKRLKRISIGLTTGLARRAKGFFRRPPQPKE